LYTRLVEIVTELELEVCVELVAELAHESGYLQLHVSGVGRIEHAAEIRGEEKSYRFVVYFQKERFWLLILKIKV
jgi:hypothetical protein